VTAVVALGSNLGDRASHLRAAMDLLAGRFAVTAVSPIYESEPAGVTDQPLFLNAVALVEGAQAWELFEAGQLAEEMRGRRRSMRWGPRTLDVDVISVAGVCSVDPRLTLPHPRAHERAFVLLPWLDVDPAAELPGHGPVRTLVRRVGTDGVRRWRG
jgi:2-amino-4-hydroxy-6-hydroxymethyldihydropteridine diphosphokinase